MPVDPARAKSLFLAASDLPAVDRAAFLHRECGGDADLRDRVEALLRADEGAPVSVDPTGTFDPARGTVDLPSDTSPTGTFGAELHRPSSLATGAHLPGGPTATYEGTPTRRERSPATTLGTVIAGRYTLVEVIGEGGMGSVYLATQTEPVKRQVALKLIKTGMDSKAVLARFDAERQALALMDHPNIARIYDGGITPAGQPFFVMELVHGVPLTDYCDQKRLTVDARLQLFVSVCQAVQHAHQKGIIHRDLKPGNVLVTEVDSRPTPKVIDFGVAKATELKLTDMSFADTGAIVGTPAYMSPEQADPSSMDIDTRTDVYALGVMLYELLTGSPPIDSKQFKRGAILEMLRMVREVEPPRPSTKLSTAEALPKIAANRNIEPAKLAKLLQGELDWVVMKALEKDRTRRYDTANGLAQDLQRYLADEVVEARPPSRGYRLKKFVKRNRGQVLAASLVLTALVVGIVGTSLGLVQAEQAREAEAKRVTERDEALAKADEALGREAERVRERDGANLDLKKANDQMLTGVARSLMRPLAVQVRPGKPLPPLNEQEIEPLWELASSRDERLRLRFVEVALRDAVSTRRLKDRSVYAFHAAVGLERTRRTQVEELLNERLQAQEIPPEEQVDVALCLAQLGGIRDRRLAKKTATTLVQSLSKTTDLVALRSLAEGLSAVATHLEPKEAAEYAATLIQAMSKSTDYSRLTLLVKGFSAVATRLEPKEATEVAATLIKTITTNQFGFPAKMQGLSAVVTRLGPMEAAAVASVITQSMSKNTDTESLIHKAESLSVVAARLEPREAARVCGQASTTLIQAVSTATHNLDLQKLAGGLSAVATHLEPKEAAEVATTLIEAMSKHKNMQAHEYALQDLARCLSRVASRLEPKKVAQVCGQAAVIITQNICEYTSFTALEAMTHGLSAVATHLESKEAGEVAGTLAQAMIKTTDITSLQSQVKCLSVLSARLAPREAGEVAATLAQAMSQIKAEFSAKETRGRAEFRLGYVSQSLSAVAARMEPREAARVCGQAAVIITQAMSMAFESFPSHLLRGLFAVAAHLEPNEASQVAQAIVSKRPQPFQSQFFAEGLSVVAARLEPKEVAAVAAIYTQTMYKDQRLSPEMAQYLSAVAARLEPKEAARICGQAAAILIRDMVDPRDTIYFPGHVKGLSAVAALLDPREAAAVADTLNQAMGKTTDPASLSALAKGLSVVATRLEPREAAATLIQAMSKTTDPFVLRSLAQGLSAMGTRLDSKESARVCGQTFAILAQVISKTMEPPPVPARQADQGNLLPLFDGLSAVLSLQAPLPAQALVDLLKHPFCVGESRRLVLAQLSRHYNRPFADQWEFVDFVTEKKLPLDLLAPFVRPQDRLTAFLRGDFKPTNNDERLALVGLCRDKNQHRPMVSLYAEAFAADPKLPADLGVAHRYHAARAAALAATADQGRDEPPLDDSARAKLRGQALDWLRAELSAWGRHPSQLAILRMVGQWQQDGDLVAIRDKEALAKLPAEEQQAFTKLWADVAELRKTAESRFRALPVAAQVEEVRKELQERNPGYDGKPIPTIEKDAVTGLNLNNNPRVVDLTPLKGMPLNLKSLGIMHTGVTDLTPLNGMPLETLMAWGWRGSDLTPLKGMPLKWLNCGGGGGKPDLTPLAGLPLDFLCINVTQVSDLGPLKDVSLTQLLCSNTQVTDLTPLSKMRLRQLNLANCKVSDLAPIQGMPLKGLEIQGTPVTDLSPVKGMPLEDIRLTPKNITKGLEILRSMKSLKTIGISDAKAWPAAEFWARYDKGEFKE